MQDECSSLQDDLTDFVLEESAQRRRVRRHLETCRECRGRFLAQEDVLASLSMAAGEEHVVSGDFADRVLRRLESPDWMGVLRLAAALVLALTAGLFLGFYGSGGSESPSHDPAWMEALRRDGWDAIHRGDASRARWTAAQLFSLEPDEARALEQGADLLDGGPLVPLAALPEALKDTSLLETLGRRRLEAGDRQSAREIARWALSRGGGRDLVLAVAEDDVRAGQPAEAAGLIQGLLEQRPQDRDALFLLGRIQLATGNADDVRAMGLRLETEARLLEAAVLALSGSLEESLLRLPLDGAQRLSDSFPADRLIRALYCVKVRDRKGAVRWLEGLEDDFGAALATLRAVIDHEAAEEAYRGVLKRLESDPSDAEAWLLRARIEHLRGKVVESMQSAGRSAAVGGPAAGHALLFRASLLIKVGRHFEAVNDLHRAMSLPDSPAGCERALAEALLRSRRFDEASSLLLLPGSGREILDSLAPPLSAGDRALAEAAYFERTDRLEEAHAAYLRAEAAAGDAGLVRRAHAAFLQREGRYEEALDVLQPAIEAGNLDLKTRLLAVHILVGLGRFRIALDLLEDAGARDRGRRTGGSLADMKLEAALEETLDRQQEAYDGGLRAARGALDRGDAQAAVSMLEELLDWLDVDIVPALLLAAEALGQSGNPTLAGHVYMDAIRVATEEGSPHLPEAALARVRFVAGTTSGWPGRDEAALLRAGIAARPLSGSLRLELAKVCIEMGDHDEARAALRAFLAMGSPRSRTHDVAEAHMLAGRLFRVFGNPGRALEQFRLAGFHSTALAPLEERARTLIDRGDLDEATRILQARLSDENRAGEPETAGLLILLCRAARLQGQPLDAVRYGEAATTLSKRRADAWTELGLARLDLGRLEAAHQDLSRALELEAEAAPRSVLDRTLAGWPPDSHEEAMAACARVRLAAEVETRRARILFLLGETFGLLGDLAAQEHAWRLSLATNPAHTRAAGALSRLLLPRDAETAAQILERTLTLDPGWAEGCYLQAQALHVLGKPDAAAAGLDRAIALGLERSNVYRLLASVRDARGDGEGRDRALATAEALWRAEQKQARSYFERALARLDIDHVEARRDLTLALSLDPDHAGALFQRARLDLLDLRRAESLRSLGSFLERVPDGWSVFEAAVRENLDLLLEADAPPGVLVEPAVRLVAAYIHLVQAQGDWPPEQDGRAPAIAAGREEVAAILRVQPTHLPARILQAWFDLMEGAPESRERVEALVGDAPEIGVAWYLRSLLLESEGNENGARDSLEQARKLGYGALPSKE